MKNEIDQKEKKMRLNNRTLKRYISIALQQARKSDMTQQHGSILVDSKGQAISKGL